MSAHASTSASSFAVSVAAQSRGANESRHCPASLASHVAPSATASFPRSVISATTPASQAGSFVPPASRQQPFISAHHALAKRAGKSAADTGVPLAVLLPPQPAVGTNKMNATRRDGMRTAALSHG